MEPKTHLRIHVLKVRGLFADAKKLEDTYVVIKTPSNRFQTAISHNEVTPDFSYDFFVVPDFDMSSIVTVEVWGKGIGGIANELFGKVDLNIATLAGKYSYIERYFELTPERKDVRAGDVHVRIFLDKDSGALHKGFLMMESHAKISQMKKWKKRYFVLTRDGLDYYHDEEQTFACHHLEFKNTTYLTVDADEDIFSVNTATDVWRMHPETQGEFEQWVTSVVKFIPPFTKDHKIVEYFGVPLRDLIRQLSAEGKQKNVNDNAFIGTITTVAGKKTENDTRFVYSQEDTENVPYFIAEIISFIRTNITEEGLFRLSASNQQIALARERIDRGLSVFQAQDSPHLGTALLKAFLRELPQPIFPASLISDFVKIRTLPKQEAIIKLRDLVSILPRQNYILLSVLFSLLHDIALNKELNKMTPANLATVVGPNLLWDISLPAQMMILTLGKMVPIYRLMITKTSEIFFGNRDKTDMQEDDVKTSQSNAKPTENGTTVPQLTASKTPPTSATMLNPRMSLRRRQRFNIEIPAGGITEELCKLSMESGSKTVAAAISVHEETPNKSLSTTSLPSTTTTPIVDEEIKIANDEEHQKEANKEITQTINEDNKQIHNPDNNTAKSNVFTEITASSEANLENENSFSNKQQDQTQQQQQQQQQQQSINDIPQNKTTEIAQEKEKEEHTMDDNEFYLKLQEEKEKKEKREREESERKEKQEKESKEAIEKEDKELVAKMQEIAELKSRKYLKADNSIEVGDVVRLLCDFLQESHLNVPYEVAFGDDALFGAMRLHKKTFIDWVRRMCWKYTVTK